MDKGLPKKRFAEYPQDLITHNRNILCYEYPSPECKKLKNNKCPEKCERFKDNITTAIVRYKNNPRHIKFIKLLQEKRLPIF